MKFEKILSFLIIIVISCKDSSVYDIKDIKSSFSGIVIDSIAYRENLYTHIKIKRYKKKDTVVFILPKEVNFGDSILKKANSPFVDIYSKKNHRKLIYVLISKELMNDEDFPLEWKKRCMNEWKEAMIK